MRVAKAEGCMYFLEDGNKVVDMCSGNLTTTFGHNFQEVNESVKRHSDLRGLVYPHRVHDRFRHELKDFGPFDWHMLPSQDIAIEYALMCAMERHPNPHGTIATLPGGYFGRTLATGHFNYQFLNYRRAFDIVELQPDEIANYPFDFDAFIFEPIQLRSGYSLGQKGLQELREVCDNKGAYLISNEIFTGLGRCGVVSQLSSSIAQPDIVIHGSGITQGLSCGVIGLNTEIFCDNFCPEVLWQPECPLCCGVASDVIHMLKAQLDFTLHSIQLGEAWVDFFGSREDMSKKWKPRIEGSMIHLFGGSESAALANTLLTEHQILVAEYPPWLMIAPCFTMPMEINQRAIEAIEALS